VKRAAALIEAVPLFPPPTLKAMTNDAYEIPGDLVWPSELALLPRPPAVVYLDQNHFVNMARIIAGKPASGYAELLGACRRSLHEGRAIFPLSSTHLMETTAIANSQRRNDLASVMGELSGFLYLLGRPIIQKLEVEESLRAMGVDVGLGGALGLIGRGGLYPIGHRSEFVITSEDGKAPEPESIDSEAIRQLMAANWEAQRLILTGGDEDHSGTPPWKQIVRNRAAREIGQARSIDAEPEWRRERLRDVVAANEVYHELNEILATEIANRIGLQDLFPEIGDARRLTDGMPSTRVAITIKTHYHRNREHPWKENDVYDIDFLSVAVPYCDAVYTDKAVRNALVRNEDVRQIFGTFMPRHPHELAEWLNARPAQG
jgi:hypothetical protein